MFFHSLEKHGGELRFICGDWGGEPWRDGTLPKDLVLVVEVKVVVVVVWVVDDSISFI